VTRFDYDGVEVASPARANRRKRVWRSRSPTKRLRDCYSVFVDAEITPAGLGARDTLRLEAALPLYGHELTLTSTTLEARWAGSSAGTRRRSASLGGRART